MILKKLFPFLLLILLCSIAIRPLVARGFYPMHDDQQIVRLAQLDQALKDGIFPVRWVADLGFGYGYPLFNFYPPLVYYLGEVFYLGLHLSYISAIKGVIVCSFVMAAITMYGWAKRYYGTIPALIAAAFYTYAPYRAVDVYVRGALAEAFSFVWLPLILLCIDRLIEELNRNKSKTKDLLKWGLSLSLSYGALMITHNLIVLPFSLLIPVYVLLKVLPNPFKKIRAVTYCAIGCGIGVLWTTFFWLPALVEKHYTLVDAILLTERYSHEQHYVAPTQLWNSLWGYGGSSPDQLDGFSLKIGKIHIGVSLLAFSGVVVGGVFSQQKKNNKRVAQIVTCWLLFVLSAVMTTKYSSLVWDTITPLQFLQFPWRFLTFTTLFSSMLAAGLVWIIQVRFRNFLFIGAVCLGLLLALFIPNAKLFQPQYVLDVTDEYYTNEEFTKWKISKSSFEFAPKQVATRIEPPLNITQIAIDQNQLPTGMIQNKSGVESSKVILDRVHHKIARVSTTQESIVQFNTFFFPGWVAKVNGKNVPIDTQNPLHLIGVPVFTGTHTVEIMFEDTPIRKLANGVSSVTIVAMVVLVYRYRVITPRIKI